MTESAAGYWADAKIVRKTASKLIAVQTDRPKKKTTEQPIDVEVCQDCK